MRHTRIKLTIMLSVAMALMLTGCSNSLSGSAASAAVSDVSAAAPPSVSVGAKATVPFVIATVTETRIYDNTYEGLISPETYADGSRVDYSVIYPQLKDDGTQSEFVQWANDSIETGVNNLISKGSEFLRSGEDAVVVTMEWDYEIKRNDGEILSIVYSGFADFGTAYPTNYIATETYDVATAQQKMTIADLFIVDAYETQLLDALLKTTDYQIYADYITRDQLEVDLKRADSYLTDTHLGIIYEEGILGPHALGIPTFEIPLENLSDILNEKFK